MTTHYTVLRSNLTKRYVFRILRVCLFDNSQDLAPGDLFTEGKLLHIKIEPLGTSNAITLTGPARGRDLTFLNTVSSKPSHPERPGS